jgi:hypothetical protein
VGIEIVPHHRDATELAIPGEIGLKPPGSGADLAVLLVGSVVPTDELGREGNDGGLPRPNEDRGHGGMGIGDSSESFAFFFQTGGTGDLVGGDGLGPVEGGQKPKAGIVGRKMPLLEERFADPEDQGSEERGIHGIKTFADVGIGGNLLNPEERLGIVPVGLVLEFSLGIKKGGMLKVKNAEGGGSAIFHGITIGRSVWVSRIRECGRTISELLHDLVEGGEFALGLPAAPGRGGVRR